MARSFRYSAVNQSGRVVRGKMNAVGVKDLERRLHRLGLSIINGSEIKSRSVGISSLFQQTVNYDDLAQFCFYIERLVAGGVPLLDGLADVRDSVSNASLRSTVSALIEDVEEGSTLSNAMKRHPRVFDDVFVSLIEAGEHSGELDTILRNLGENIRWQSEISKKTKSAFRYPLFAMIVIMLATWALFVLVVPAMTKIIESLGRELPPETVALIATSSFLVDNGLNILIGIFVGYVLIFIFTRTIPGFDYVIDRIKVRIPIVGTISEKILLSRFSNTFGLLYAAGVNVIDGLRISRGSLGNKFMARGLDGVIRSISGGTSLSSAFGESGLFPPLVLRMVRLGESTGGIDFAMAQVKSYYDRDANELISALQATITPILLLVAACLLVWVVIAVYGPLYDLVSEVQA